MNIKANKDKLRKWAKEIRSNLDIRYISLEINKRILALSAFKTAKNVMSYYPTKSEISLLDLFNNSNKNWFLPCIEKSQKNILLAVPHTHNKTKLIPNTFNILEPEIENNIFFDQVIKKIDLDIIFVPGLCFDKKGYRLGYGKGYYDSFLKENPNSLKIGICPKDCYIDEVPRDPWDLKVDLVITEG